MDEILFSSKSNEWATPNDLFVNLDKKFHFTLDPAATDENHKCTKYYTKEDDGLDQSWWKETVFLNPPYGREIGKWVEKIYRESQRDCCDKVLLIPARTDTKYFTKYCCAASELYFIQGRLKFSDSKNSAPFPSVIVVFNQIGFTEKGRDVYFCNKDFSKIW